MTIKKGTTVAVIVNRHWANLAGIRMFLRQGHEPNRQIRGTDESHVVIAEVLDSNDPHGFWIELNSEKHKKDPSVKRFSFLVPWGSILGIVLTEKFSPEIWKEVKKLGF